MISSSSRSRLIAALVVLALCGAVVYAKSEKTQEVFKAPTHAEEHGTSMRKVFATLFPFESPAYNSILATFYISSIPNFILLAVPATLEPSSLNTMIAFATGGLLGDVFLHLVPHSFFGEGHDESGAKTVVVEEKRNIVIGGAIFLGFAAFFVLDKTMRVLNASAGEEGHSHGHSHSHSHSHAPKQDASAGKSTSVSTSTTELRSRKSPKDVTSITPTPPADEGKVEVNPSLRLSAYLNLFGDFTHNITDGLAMAASFYSSPALGAVTTIATFCHEIPHEIADYSILIKSGFTKSQAMGSQFFTAVGAFVGTFLGIWIAETSGAGKEGVLEVGQGVFGTSVSGGDLVIPATAGGFLYIASVSVIPELLAESRSGKQAIKEYAAMAFGVFCMVHIAGNFNNWSATATPLNKLSDGTFAAEVPLPWGEKQAFKYVVDGEWKVREDEAKEWDAAGNMNNVYTAPPAAAAAATHEHGSSTAGSASASKPSSVPTRSEPDTAALSTATASSKTEPDALMAASAPGAASAPAPAPASADSAKGQYMLGGVVLGGAISSSSSKPAPTSFTTTTTTSTPAPAAASAPAPVPAPAAVSAPAPVVSADTTVAPDPAAQQTQTKSLLDEPTPIQIEEVAKHSNIGEATTASQQPGFLARAAEFSEAAVAAATAAVGSAAAVVERATGYDLAHGSPLSVEEAKAQGIDVNSLKTVDASNDTPTPVGTGPDASAVAALEEKVQELKVGSTSSAPRDQVDVPLPNGQGSQTSVAPEAVGISQQSSEDKTEHDLPAQDETADNHTIVPAPVIVAISERDPAKDRTLNSSNVDDTIGTKTISSAPGDSAKAAKEEVDANPAGTSGPASNPAPAAAPATISAANPVPSTPSKQNGVGSNAVSAPAPVGSGTPAPVSATSTPASTPARSSHVKEGTDSEKKKKSGFLNKIKSAVSRKDKK